MSVTKRQRAAARLELDIEKATRLASCPRSSPRVDHAPSALGNGVVRRSGERADSSRAPFCPRRMT